MTTNNYKLVGLRRFVFTKYEDRYTFYAPVPLFDSVKVMNLSWKTPTTNNNTIEFLINSHPEFNQGSAISTDGTIQEYMYQTILDPRTDVAIYSENLNPVFDLSKPVPNFNQFTYKILINTLQADVDISPTNPLYIEIGFFKRLLV